MKAIILIWKKELSDAIRDRRTLFSMILVPMLLMPVMIFGMNKLMMSQIKSMEKSSVRVGIVHSDKAPQLASFLAKQKDLIVVDKFNNINAAIKNKVIDVGLEPPLAFEKQLNDLIPIKIKVYNDSTSMQSSGMSNRVHGLLQSFDKQLVEDRIKKHGLNPKILSALDFEIKDVASERERGGFGLGFILPLIIVMWSIAGGQTIAIDVSAGEKERKTLEPLLLTSVKRIEIVWGKLLAVATAASVTVVISLFSMLAAFIFIGLGGLSGDVASPNQSSQIASNFSIEPLTMIILLITSLMMIVMFSSLYLSVSICAKSYKEAQSYAGIIYLVLILPVAILNAIPTLSVKAAFFLIPVVNSALLFKEVLIGKFDWIHIALTLGSLMICAITLVLVATRVYNREDVMVG